MRIILHGIIWIVALSGVQAFADVVNFTGAYAPGNWSVSGTGIATPAFAQITVTGTDDQSGAGSITEVMIVPSFKSFVSFDWSYLTLDESADHDPAGYQIGNTLTPLVDTNSFAQLQSGSTSLTLLPGQAFGFYVQTWDNIGGAATLTISNFTAITASPSPVPEPSTYAMVGLAAAATLLRKRFVSTGK